MSIDAINAQLNVMPYEIAAAQRQVDLCKRRLDNLIEARDVLIRRKTLLAKAREGFLTIPDAAVALGIKAARLRGLIHKGDISAEQVEGFWWFISAEEIASILKGGWLNAICEGHQANGIKCQSPVIRESKFCRAHQPNRRRTEQSPLDRPVTIDAGQHDVVFADDDEFDIDWMLDSDDLEFFDDNIGVNA